MSDWIRLDPDQVTKATTETRREGGVQITVALSPYDIPQAVRGRFDRDLGRYVVEFQYIAEEPWEKHTRDESIALRVGKNSGRIYGVEIDVERAKEQRVGLHFNISKIVNKALDEEVTTKSPRSRNYELAKDVISTRRISLFGDLVESG
jgi:hypothetical protein